MNCKFCNKESKSNNANAQHEIRCRDNPNRISMDYLNINRSNAMVIPETPCVYCGKIIVNKLALGNHQTRCSMNPNRKLQVQTPAGKARSIAKNKERIWTDEMRLNHSASMKQAVKENPESYTSSNRGRTKQIIVDGIKLQGQWEVDFYLWAKEKGLNPKRPDRAFKYSWNGERFYHPDFYIESLNLYVEVKGYETDRDRAKWSQFPEKLVVIKSAEIKKIRQGCFNWLVA